MNASIEQGEHALFALLAQLDFVHGSVLVLASPVILSPRSLQARHDMQERDIDCGGPTSTDHGLHSMNSAQSTIDSITSTLLILFNRPSTHRNPFQQLHQ
jgi:hypothetical protein